MSRGGTTTLSRVERALLIGMIIVIVIAAVALFGGVLDDMLGRLIDSS
jgi:Flp pilus assembly pilin Flp